MVFAGIDYSLTSPSICVHTGTEWSYENCKFYYMVNNEKFLESEDKKYVPSIYPSYGEDSERFDNLSEWSIRILRAHSVNYVSLEGYAFGAVGRVFQIAENGGLLKYKLWQNKMPVVLLAPTSIKKFATGKGNSNKEAMVEAFEQEAKVDIREKCGITNKQWNPISDIVDAYYIAKFNFYEMREKS